MVVRMQGDGHQGQIDQVVVLNIDAGDSVKKGIHNLAMFVILQQ